MAIPAYSAVDPDFLKRLREYETQQEIVTGRPPAKGKIQALSEAQLNVTAERAVRDRLAFVQADVAEREMAVREKQLKSQELGAKVSGITGAVSTVALGKMAWDTMRKPPAITPGAPGMPGTPAVTGVTPTTGATVTGAAVSEGAGAVSAPGGLAVATPESLAAYDASIAEGAAAGVGTVPAGGTGAGLSAASALEAGGYGAAGYLAGSLIASKIFGANATISGGVGGAIGGGVAGYMIGAEIGSVGGPIGAAVGFVVGGVIGAVTGDSIICTELYRQGLITRRERLGASMYGIDSPTALFVGYHDWANPKVDRMRQSKQYTRWVYLWAYPCIREMGYRKGQLPKGNIFGKILLPLFERRCLKHYRRHAAVMQEV